MKIIDARTLALCATISASGLSACTTAGVSTETTALNDAAAHFEAVATATSPISAAEANVAQARMLQAAVGGSIEPLNVSCSAQMQALQAKFTSDVAAGQPAETLNADYAALLSVPSCGPPAAPAASPVEQIDLIVDLNAYFTALEALGTAKDATTFDTAANGLSTAISGFAAAAGVGAPEQATAGVFSKLAQTALQDAEYQAMKRYVSDMDGLLARAAPAIVSALRVEQTYYMTVIENDAGESAGILNQVYQSPAVTRQSSTALAVYAASAPIITGIQSEQASARIDPATAVKALITAHHALLLALQSDKGQFPAIVSSVTDIANSASAFVTPSTAATKPAAKSTAKKSGG